jgi:N-acetylglucosamine malate deacetylase 1
VTNKILVVSPHPDDETLGCGGTLLRHAEEGDHVHWLIMTTITQQAGFSKEKIDSRAKEIVKVADAYSFVSVKQADFVATQLDTYSKSDLVSIVSEMVSRIQPDIIYLPYRDDVHSDHAEVFDAVSSCTKSFRYPSVKRVRVYETLSETEFSINPQNSGFKPNLWVDISDYLDSKIEIMKMYKGEMESHPFPRSELNLRALATLRGSTAGVNSAEGFISLKEIV